ncbi:MAG: pentapeptide repeat-containing protein [Nitrospirales bacterium]|nr:pentapeptide repeat-containing protein [Nitrospirales bacterium]
MVKTSSILLPRFIRSLGIFFLAFRMISCQLLGVMLVCGVGLPTLADACRLLERPSGLEEVFWVHLDEGCSAVERRELAVSGADVLAALEQGKSVDLNGVVVTGDVMLDRLSTRRVADLSSLSVQVREELTQQRLETIRFIPGSLRIRESQFEKVLATNLSKGALLILGEVDLTDAVFVRSLDWSKTIFVHPATFKGMRVDFEGFFIGARFMQTVDFSHAQFGTHSRFYKAVFGAPVNFKEVQFKGIAEFLEVNFRGEANFSQAAFESGTGFSGSVFQGLADFSGAVFTHETYFRFSEFTDRIRFTGTDFEKTVDFSNARFAKPADFSGASFALRPEHEGSNLALPELSPVWWKNPVILLVISVCLLLLVGIHYLRTGKKF